MHMILMCHMGQIHACIKMGHTCLLIYTTESVVSVLKRCVCTSQKVIVYLKSQIL
jgi:hypothetical protein